MAGSDLSAMFLPYSTNVVESIPSMLLFTLGIIEVDVAIDDTEIFVNNDVIDAITLGSQVVLDDGATKNDLGKVTEVKTDSIVITNKATNSFSKDTPTYVRLVISTDTEAAVDISLFDLLPFKLDRSILDPESTDTIVQDMWEPVDGDSLNGLVSHTQYPGPTSRYRDITNIRGVAFRLPMIGVGWGFDTEGNPAPAGNAVGKFRGEVDTGHEVDPQHYIAAPIDLRYDKERKVWAATGAGILQKHRHLENSAGDGGPAFASFFR